MSCFGARTVPPEEVDLSALAGKDVIRAWEDRAFFDGGHVAPHTAPLHGATTSRLPGSALSGACRQFD